MNKLGLFYAPIKRDIEAKIAAGVYNDEMGQLAVAPKSYYVGMYHEKDMRGFKRVAAKDGKRLRVRSNTPHGLKTYWLEWD